MYYNSSDNTPNLSKGAKFREHSPKGISKKSHIIGDRKQQRKTLSNAPRTIDMKEDNTQSSSKTQLEINCNTIFINSDEEDIVEKGNLAPLISACVGSIPCEVLIDSGSSVTCISEKFYRNLMDKNKDTLQLPVSGVKIVGATGGRSKTVKCQVYIKLKIEDKEFHLAALVVENLICNVIIGTDWLNKEECQIDFGEKALRVRNTKCTFVRMESKSGKEHDMFVISDRNFEYVNALSQVFEKEILELTAQFSTLFSDEPGRTNVYIHKIRLSDDKPFKPRSYPIP